jgi:DNA-binding GntR family transcriptional regulator
MTQAGLTEALTRLPLLDRRTLADIAYEHLRELLVSGRLAPGERLSLRELGQALGVSVMPVREAVNRLVADRALEVTQGRVLRVPRTSVSQLHELAEIRVVVEGFAAERAALVRSPEQLATIAASEAAFRAEATRAEPDPGRAIALNWTVHFAIYDAAGLPMLQEMIGDLWLKAGPVLNLDLRGNPERLASGGAVRFHAAALAAIGAGDGAAARAAIEADIRGAAAFIIARGALLQD